MATPSSNKKEIDGLKACIRDLTLKLADTIRLTNTYLNLYDTYDTTFNGKAGFSPIVHEANPDNPEDIGLLLEKAVRFQDLYGGNAVIYGGYSLVPGTTNQYYVWASAYIINGILYATADDFVSGIVTLAAAPTSPDQRIDLFIIRKGPGDPAVVAVKQGTAEPSPLEPPLDLTQEVKLGFKLLTSDEVTPPDIVTEIIYDENEGEPNEWTNTIATIGIDLDSVIEPYSNTKHVWLPSHVTGQKNTVEVAWTNDAPIPYNAKTKVIFALQVNGKWNGPQTRDASIITIQLKNAGVTVASIFLNKSNIVNFGYNPNDYLNPYLVTIPITSFLWGATRASYDEIYYKHENLAISYLDSVYLQDGLEQPPPPSDNCEKLEEIADCGSVLKLTNQHGVLSNMASANDTLFYTFEGTVAGAWHKVLINASSLPEVDGAFQTYGATFTADVNMYLVLVHNGNRAEWWIEQITV